MSISEHLVLALHVAFVVFTIGPLTLAIMSTPRYIRQGDARILRYLARITFIFLLGSIGVLILGMVLASMLSEAGKPWIIVSATLFLVAIVLLVLIVRDQRKAIKAVEAGTAHAGTAHAGTAHGGTAQAGTAHAGTAQAGTAQAAANPPTDDPATAGPGEAASTDAAGPAAGQDATGHLATVERGRIAMLGGVVSLIWLVILVLMVWNS